MTQLIGEEDADVEEPSGEGDVGFGEAGGDEVVEVQDREDLEGGDAVESEEENEGGEKVEAGASVETGIGCGGGCWGGLTVDISFNLTRFSSRSPASRVWRVELKWLSKNNPHTLSSRFATNFSYALLNNGCATTSTAI